MAKVTLRQIAELVGCTRSTVSYALRNDPQISASIRARVQQVARDLGWQADADLAKQMAIVRSTAKPKDLPNVAIVINKPSTALALEVTPKCQLDGARQRAVELGYQPSLFNLADQPLTASRFRGILKARGVEGIVFIGTAGTELAPEILDVGLGYASAVAGVKYAHPAFHTSISDFLACGREAVLQLHRLGFRRIGTLLPRALDVCLERGFFAGVLSGMVEFDDFSPDLIHYAGQDEIYVPESAYPEAARWIQEKRLDAILTTDVRNTVRLTRSLPAPWNRLPIFSLDWFEDGLSAGGIDGLHLAVGAAATDLVVAQVHRREAGLPPIRKVVEITGQWKLARGLPAHGEADTPALAFI